jgi:hypothetical protein
MYSSIFAFTLLSESDGERSSSTKSGQSGGNDLRCSAVSAFHRSSLTHERSGDRFAPLGSRNIAFDSKQTPVPFLLAHVPRSVFRLKLCLEVSPPVGGRMMMSPSFDISIRMSGFWRHNSRKSSSVTSFRIASRLMGKDSSKGGAMSVCITVTS